MRIDIWSDFACPWCALGIYRLDAALGQFEHADVVEIVHRAFELDPRAPARRELSMQEAVMRKYGRSPEQVEAGHRQLTAFGHEVGMDFDFDRIQLGNTFDAHRLARSAQGTGLEDAVVKGLFAAYFTNGLSLSDPAVLLAVATDAGLDETSQAVIAGDAFGSEVVERGSDDFRRHDPERGGSRGEVAHPESAKSQPVEGGSGLGSEISDGVHRFEAIKEAARKRRLSAHFGS